LNVIHVVNNRYQGTRTKSGRNQQVPMTSKAHALLEQWGAEGSSHFVFCNPDTGLPYADIKLRGWEMPALTRSNWRRSWVGQTFPWPC